MSAQVQSPIIGALPAIDLAHDALLFDVDGTLLDLAERPENVVVPDTLRQSLAELKMRCGGAIALVSGRKLSVVEALFAPLKLPTVGCHGAEMRLNPDGPEEICAPPVPANVRAAFADLGKLDSRIFVEDKGFTLAFHYRAAMDVEDRLLKMARERLKPFEPQFTMLHGKAIIEIKSVAFDKGVAITRIMAAAPFAGRRPVYAGDDTTDETAFAALPELGGIGISVGRKMDGAQFMVSDPKAMRAWLAKLAGIKKVCV
jgi:trehalose 6-phosphate phosphatase